MKKRIVVSLLYLALCGCETNSSFRKSEGVKSDKPAVKINPISVKVDDNYRQSFADIETQGVNGIIYSTDNPCAVVGSRIVSVGDVVNGATVVKINPKSVEFERDNNKWTQYVENNSTIDNKFRQARAETERQIEDLRKKKINLYFEQNPDLSESIKNCILNEEIKIGITKEQVLLSLGNPADIHRTVSSAGVNEQWVYGDVTAFSNSMRYLYFENGVLTSWQE